jgi:hypothetical protein
MRPRNRLKRRLVLVGGIGIVLLLLATIGVPLLLVGAARSQLDRRLAGLSEAIGRTVTVGELSPGLTEDLTLNNLRVPSLDGQGSILVVPRVRLGFSLWDVLTGKARLSRIVLEEPRFEVRLDGVAAPDLADLVQALRRYRQRRAQGGSSAEPSSWPRLAIEAGVLTVFQDAFDAPVATLDGLAFEMHRGESGFDATFAGDCKGLSPVTARVEGVGTWDGGKGFYLNLDASERLSVSRIAGSLVPSRMGFSGIGIEIEPARELVRVRLRSILVDDTSPWLVRLPGDWVNRGGMLGAEELRLDLRMTAGGLVGVGALSTDSLDSLALRGGFLSLEPARSPWKTLDVTRLELDAGRDSGNGDLTVIGKAVVDLGGHGPTRIVGEGRIGPGGAIRSIDASIAGPTPVQIASMFHANVLPWAGAEIETSVSVRGDDDGTFRLAGRVEGSGLAYFWTKICLAPLTDLAFDARFEALLDPANERLSVTVDPVSVGRATFRATLELERFSRDARLKVGFRIPRQSCSAVASAIPPVMIPRLAGAVFRGQMEMDVAVSVDFGSLDGKKIEGASLKATGDLEKCEALTLGKRVRLDRLLEPTYVYEVREEELDKPIRLGPGTPSWVSYGEIPDYVGQAALATEDMGFFRHSGFMPNLIRRAIVLNLDRGWYVYGGSTITQQLVKNLFLSREKTLARKLEEAIIVWQMERTLPKERILELYLNCIEYGRHIYGIRHAARAYFNKDVGELTPLDAAFIMATKPAPRYAYSIYEKRTFNRWWLNRMRGILERLWKPMGILDEAAFLAASPYLPLFWYPEDGTYARPATDASVVVPPGMPADLPRDPAPVAPPP